ncbi:hypothetical protein HRG84_13620 [Flavisolibacter sp. BT320]|nr:hypothetical protein [Flavisolibacter longurius]
MAPSVFKRFKQRVPGSKMIFPHESEIYPALVSFYHARIGQQAVVQFQNIGNGVADPVSQSSVANGEIIQQVVGQFRQQVVDQLLELYPSVS